MKRNLNPSLFIKLSALAAAVALQGAALAATPTAAAESTAPAVAQVQQGAAAPDAHAAHPHRHMRHHRGHRHHSAMWVPGYGPLSKQAVQSLSLNENQSQLLADAQTTQKELRKARRDSMRTARKEKFEQLKTGKIDPRAAVKETAAVHQAITDERQQATQKWLALWDSLDADQQAKIATHFDKRAEKMAAHVKNHGRHTEAAATDKSAS